MARSDPRIVGQLKDRDFVSPLLQLQQRQRQEGIDEQNLAVQESQLATAAQGREAGQIQIDQTNEEITTGKIKAMVLDTMSFADVLDTGDQGAIGQLGIHIRDQMEKLGDETGGQVDLNKIDSVLKIAQQDPAAAADFMRESVIPGIEAVFGELFESEPGQILKASEITEGGQVVTRDASGKVTAQDIEGLVTKDAEDKGFTNVTKLPDGQFSGLKDGKIQIIPSDDDAIQAIKSVIKPSERQAAIFGTRIADSNSIIDEIGSQFTGAGARLSGFAPQGLKGAERQKFDQASRNLVNALLRRESGAAIADSEFESARLQYLPVPGDKPAVLEQKKRNRDVLAKGLELEGGEAFTQLGESLSSLDIDTVDILGTERDVGSIVENDRGQRGRIEADGSITILEEGE